MGCCASLPQAQPKIIAATKDFAPTVADHGGLETLFSFEKLLGSGASGDTWLCVDKVAQKKAAIKLIKRPIPQVVGLALKREITLQARLGRGHVNLVTPQEVFLSNTHLGLVMEHVPGGNLARYVVSKLPPKDQTRQPGPIICEDEARYFFYQIVSSLDYCHKNKVAHRDIKLDNTILDTNYDPPRLKVCDFGFARDWAQDPDMSTLAGTPDYMSPDVAGLKGMSRKHYDATKADIWAAGVWLVVLLLGKFPFEGGSIAKSNTSDPVMQVYLQQTIVKWYDNDTIKDDIRELSAECVDLLNKIFEVNERKRLTLEEIRQHPWYTAPMPTRYRQALDMMAHEQQQLDDMAAKGVHHSHIRDQALHQMIMTAARRHDPQQQPPILDKVSLNVQNLMARVSLTMVEPGEVASTLRYLNSLSFTEAVPPPLPQGARRVDRRSRFSRAVHGSPDIKVAPRSSSV